MPFYPVLGLLVDAESEGQKHCIGDDDMTTRKNKADKVIKVDMINLKDLDDRTLLLMMLAMLNEIHSAISERA